MRRVNSVKVPLPGGKITIDIACDLPTGVCADEAQGIVDTVTEQIALAARDVPYFGRIPIQRMVFGK